MHLSDSDWTHIDERAEDFTGRGWVFERIRSFLASDARLLVIAGPPGTGKTAIAARLAQASAGRLPDAPPPPIPAGTIDAAVFCRAGRVSLLGVAQDLADQLSTALEGFAEEQRSTVAAGVNVSDVHAEAAEVRSGGTVIGVKVDLARLGPERAFADGLALPVRRLSEAPGFRPPVLLVDSLDEAYASAVAQALPRSLADLGAARLIVTTRDDPRVLAEIGLEAALAASRATRIHLIDDAPKDIDEVGDYASRRLRGRGPDAAMTVLAHRIGVAAEGNFLYAYHAIDGLLAASDLAGLDVPAANALPLPAGGLPGIYREFLLRRLTTDRERWRRLIRPILAPLAVALGDGLGTAQLAAIGSVLARTALGLSDARDVTDDAAQFLQGPRPDGPFRVYHQSFADFLLDPQQNAEWPVDALATHRAIVDAMTPVDETGRSDWDSCEDEYAVTNVAAHMTEAVRIARTPRDRRGAADLLGGLLTDLEYVETKTGRHGIDAVLRDYQGALPLLGAQPDVMGAHGVLDAETHNLRGWDRVGQPAFFGQQVVNRAKILGQTSIAEAARERLQAQGGKWFELRWRTDAYGQAPIRTMTGHSDAIFAIAVAPDDRQVVSGSRDRTVRVWDLGTGVCVHSLRGHGGTVMSVAFSPDGRRIVSSSTDGSIKAWDRDSGTLIFTITGHAGPVNALALTSDGRRLLSVSEDQTLRIWDAGSGAPLGVIDQGAALWGVAVLPGDTRAVCMDARGAMTVWELATGVAVRSFAAVGRPAFASQRASVSALAITPDGRTVIAPSADHRSLLVRDLVTGEDVRTIVGHRGWIRGLAVTPDRQRLVSGAADRTIRIWDLQTGAELSTLGGHEAIVSAIGLTSDGRSVVSASQDATIQVWDAHAPSGAQARTGHRGRVRWVAAARDGSRAVTAADDGIRVWDLDTGIEQATAPEGEGPVDVSRDGRAVCLSRGDDDWLIWDVGTGEVLLKRETMSPDEDHPEPVSVALAGSSLAIAWQGYRPRVWNLATDGVRDLEGLIEDDVGDVALSADGRRLAGVANDSAILVWDLERGGEARRWPGYHGNGLAITPDGRQAIWACEEHGLAVQDLRTGEVRESGGASPLVYAVRVTADGRHGLTAGEDRAIRVWDLTSGATEAHVALDGHVWCIAISDDGRLAAGVGAGDVWCLDYRNS